MQPQTNSSPSGGAGVGIFIWLPIVIAIAVVAGIFIGKHFASPEAVANKDRKINSVLNLIATDYVDTTNIDELVEKAIPNLLENLDPHTAYFTAADLRAANEDLQGSFSGIGLTFTTMSDTITVIEVLSGGPSEKVGIMAGDRIITIDDSTFVGEGLSNNEVMRHLRGPRGTTVKLGIKRSTSAKILPFTITRDNITVESVDCHYMLDKTTGYIKVNQFGANTYNEFLTALIALRAQGAERYVVDLRGNGGGYMEIAIMMANEFLPADNLIVKTRGRYKRDANEFWSDGNGAFTNDELVVLIDEYSASASEIFAGAIQDNDRGLVVGCRSFGKGLVQNQFVLADSSAVRLTIARYYTPSGRCIQKPFKGGKQADYERELYDRYISGELDSRDSVKVDSTQLFTTGTGRVVYGGGGIMPDIFVPRDTTGVSGYFIDVANHGLLHKYAFHYVDSHRQWLNALDGYKDFLKHGPTDQALIEDFATYAADEGVPPRWYYINRSRSLILSNLRALIARDVWGNSAFYPVYNRNDKTVQAALKALNKHKAAFPILPE